MLQHIHRQLYTVGLVKKIGTASPLFRGVFLLPAGLAMLAGVNAALVLVGVWAPAPTARAGDLHGMLMVGGFLATLIALERAVALRHALAFSAPLLLGAGGVALLTPLPLVVGQTLLVSGGIALVTVYAALFQRNHDDVVLGAGRHLECEYVMSNNFAFGGINTSLIFKRYD